VNYYWARKRGNCECECIATWLYEAARATPVLSLLNYDVMPSLKSLNLSSCRFSSVFAADIQWRPPNLLRGGAKMEIMVTGHSRRTSGPGAAAARWLIVLWQMQLLVERAASYWRLHQLMSQITQYLDSWLSDLLHSEQKNKIVGSRGGARAPVPHSWWRHCWYITLRCDLDL